MLWDDWEEFITGGRLGVGIDPVTAPVPPNFAVSDILGEETGLLEKSSLADYLGVPLILDTSIGTWSTQALDTMPFIAYQLVWYEYYRDRNFVADDVLEFPVLSGDMSVNYVDPAAYLQLRTRAYMHDYFTSALPFTQRGEEVLMPLAGSGSVSYLTSSELWRADGSGGSRGGSGVSIDPGTAGSPGTAGFLLDQDSEPAQIRNIDEVLIDSSSVSKILTGEG